ncbi:hydroxymethylbilane synthase [Halapricum hydrolyticum]|uniref:Hydroxymethylbilane synthase n=1 Tax=Halapricum hydrolyticum TaxID=2979991 RepID=A0AAE3LFR2_9EURY|nr:hydroxymethylbilane synthase [Halapricum hydrolyticum]MCU4718993.1 hydroxymethylbilane synthase [Halapricum hydrolyticum]MCU4727922.1 hydroxymethylbilane synthase [Halapricum hydrolyticum]
MSSRDSTLRLATRGSDLALRQAATVKEALEGRRRSVELIEVETTGDQIRDELIHRLGKTGAFVRALDERVLDGDADAAVHSLKDVPTEGGDSMVVAGVPGRGPASDVLVTPDGKTLEELPEGATIGTSSLRREAQLRAESPDLNVEPLRGNVDTRIEKLLAPTLQREHADRSDAESERKEHADDEDYEHPYDRTVEEWFNGLAEVERRALERDAEIEYDAIVLAAAGLKRLGLDHHVSTVELDPDRFVPAPGQGAIAVTAPDGEIAETINDAIDQPPTRVATTVERTVLATLGGGCIAPIGVHATVQGSTVRTTARVSSRDGSDEVTATRDLPIHRHPDAAREFAEELREQGAAELIEQAVAEAEDE